VLLLPGEAVHSGCAAWIKSIQERVEALIKLGIRGSLLFFAIFFVFSPVSLRAQEWTYTVRPGDNLWDLSERYLSSMRYWRELQGLNHISDPKKLKPGTRLKIPLAWLKVRPAPVQVLSVSGDVFFESQSRAESKALLVGARLQIKDAVRTGPKSSATLLFADGSRLTLQANSFLEFDVVQEHGETGMVDSRIRLKKGRLRTDVNPNETPGTRFEIHTPGAITAVRGTRLRVSNDLRRGISSTEVLQGRVDVIAAGEVQSVTAGFGTVIKKGEPPSSPRALLQAPVLSGLPATFDQFPLRFIWPVLEGASGYRIQISENSSRDAVRFEAAVEKSELILSDLPNGSYVMRIRGFDISQLEGFNGVHHFELNVPLPPLPEPVQAPPPPPVIRVLSKPPHLLKPQPDAVMRLEIPAFEWEKVMEANAYHFQLTDQADFFSPLVEAIDFSEQKIHLKQPLKPGVYYWRVAAADSSGKYGVFSRVQTFKIRSKPSRLKLEAPQIEKTYLQIRWWGGKVDERYEVELARDEAFGAIVSRQKFEVTNARLDRPEPGSYFLRVRAVSPEGTAGEYTKPQSIELPDEFCCAPFFFILAGLLVLL